MNDTAVPRSLAPMSLQQRDKMRDCKALAQWTRQTWDMIDQTRPQKSRMMRTASEVEVIERPEKWNYYRTTTHSLRTPSASGAYSLNPFGLAMVLVNPGKSGHPHT